MRLHRYLLVWFAVKPRKTTGGPSSSNGVRIDVLGGAAVGAAEAIARAELSRQMRFVAKANHISRRAKASQAPSSVHLVCEPTERR